MTLTPAAADRERLTNRAFAMAQALAVSLGGQVPSPARLRKLAEDAHTLARHLDTLAEEAAR